METLRVGAGVKSVDKSQDSATSTYDADAECLVASVC